MPKITESYIENYLSNLIDIGLDSIISNQTLANEVLQEHLAYIPNGKLYKYRACNRNNLSALNNNRVWMAVPKTDFKDITDFTINFDLVRNKPQIEKWFNENIDEFIYHTVKNYVESKGGVFPISLEQMKDIRNKYYYKDGKIKRQDVGSFLAQVGTAEEIEKFFVQQDKIDDYLAGQEENIERMFDTFIQALKATNEKARAGYQVYSMAESYDIASLWENYAFDYTGFCIEYSFEKYKSLPYEIYSKLLFLLPVIYKKDKPIFDITTFIDLALRQYYFGDKSIKMTKDLQLTINMQLLMKKKDYHYEREWRIMIANKQHNLQPFPFVTAIYIGKDISEKNEIRLKEIALKLGVPIYKQKLNNFINKLEYIALSK